MIVRADRNTHGAKAFGIGMAVAVGLGLGSTGAAAADTFIPLADDTITRELGDGTVVTVSITNSSAKINPSMGSTPTHRNVWVSGRGAVNVAGAKADDATIKIYPGYVVGCQVDIGALSSGEIESATAPGFSFPGGGGAPQVTPPSSAFAQTETLAIGPGQAIGRYLLDIEQPDDYGNESHKLYHKVQGARGSVSWTDETFAVDGCGGYAQARTFVAVDVATDNTESMVTVWGAPFSMG